MPRFYFNFRQGSAYTVDPDGSDFPSAETAYLGAFRAAQDMWREMLILRQDPLLCAFEVMDEAGNSLYLLPFAEVLDVCRGRGNLSKQMPALPAVLEALSCQRDARRTMADLHVAVTEARATLRETIGLLAEVERVAGI